MQSREDELVPEDWPLHLRCTDHLLLAGLHTLLPASSQM